VDADGPRVVNPASLARPRGYSNGIVLTPTTGGGILFVAGQVGWNAGGEIVSGAFVEQFGQALANVIAVVREAGGRPESIGRMTIYVTDTAQYNAKLSELGVVYRQHMGRHFPAMSLVQVAALLEPGALVEIEATAVL
jgi:enamine deaminase RidA (YjgF/YER057c/UK114 family)